MSSLLKAIIVGASLCAAMPYSVDFPSITLDIHPTFSHNVINKTIMPTSSPSNQATSYTLAIHPTFPRAATRNISSSALGACGPGVGPCLTGLCCSGYGYCGSNSSYCGTSCQPDFGTCSLNTTIPLFSFSYQPLSTSTSVSDNTGAAGIVTGDAVSLTMGLSFAPETTGSVGVPTITLSTVSGISFEPVSTTYTAVQSTWAATSYEDEASMTTGAVKKIGCAVNATSSQV